MQWSTGCHMLHMQQSKECLGVAITWITEWQQAAHMSNGCGCILCETEQFEFLLPVLTGAGVHKMYTVYVCICSWNALGALVASVSQALQPWVGARGNGFYGIDPLNTSLRKYGQQALLRRPTVFNGNNGNKDTSKEGRTTKKTPATQWTIQQGYR